MPRIPGGGLCSCRLLRRATEVGSLGRLCSWREAKREARRLLDAVGVMGEVEEAADETEAERSVLGASMLVTVLDLLTSCGNACVFFQNPEIVL